MAVKDVRFTEFTRKTAQQVKPTGSFNPGDAVLIHVNVPANASRLLILVAQVLSDADMTLSLNGQRKGGLQSVSYTVKKPAAGDYTAILTADGPVHDVNVHATVVTSDK